MNRCSFYTHRRRGRRRPRRCRRSRRTCPIGSLASLIRCTVVGCIPAVSTRIRQYKLEQLHLCAKLKYSRLSSSCSYLNRVQAYNDEQQVCPATGHLYPNFPSPVFPHVPSGLTVVPSCGAVHAACVAEYAPWQPCDVRQYVELDPQYPKPEQQGLSVGQVNPLFSPALSMPQVPLGDTAPMARVSMVPGSVAAKASDARNRASRTTFIFTR